MDTHGHHHSLSKHIPIWMFTMHVLLGLFLSCIPNPWRISVFFGHSYLGYTVISSKSVNPRHYFLSWIPNPQVLVPDVYPIFHSPSQFHTLDIHQFVLAWCMKHMENIVSIITPFQPRRRSLLILKKWRIFLSPYQSETYHHNP